MYLKKIIYFSLAIISLIFALIGVVLPMIPATPFILAASFFAFRSSDRLNVWIKKQKFYAEHIDGFIENKTMERHAKIKIYIFAFLMLMFPMYFSNSTILRLVIVVLLMAKYYCFFYLIKDKEEN